jgi:hypothetical protein
MNEIQIIQNQLATEQHHFSEVASACSAALDSGTCPPGSAFATACAEYFAFAVSRFAPAVSGSPPDGSILSSPTAASDPEGWREFLRAFNDASRKHFAAVDELLTRNLPITEWRAVSRIDADTIFCERARYARVKATLPP